MKIRTHSEEAKVLRVGQRKTWIPSQLTRILLPVHHLTLELDVFLRYDEAASVDTSAENVHVSKLCET